MRTKMRVCKILPLAAALLLIPAMPRLQGQAAANTTNRSPMMYDTTTETTVKGTVEAVHEMKGRRGWHGTHLQLKSNDATLDVHVGPSWYLTRQKFAIAQGDQITVVGSKIRYKGADALVARTIKKGETTITLRNAQGIPLWSRRRRF